MWMPIDIFKSCMQTPKSGKIFWKGQGKVTEFWKVELLATLYTFKISKCLNCIFFKLGRWEQLLLVTRCFCWLPFFSKFMEPCICGVQAMLKYLAGSPQPYGWSCIARALFKVNINCNMNTLYIEKAEDIAKAVFHNFGTI